MAVRTTWSGSISFGLVNIPVGTTPAVSEKDVKFSTFSEDGVSLGRAITRKDTNEIYNGTVLRGQKIGDKVVTVEDDELSALAPKASKAIEISEFVNLSDVDPVYFARHELALPKDGGGKAYALLVEALERTGKAGVGRTVRRSKEHVVLVRAVDGGLVLTFLNYHDEVKPVSALDLEQRDLSEAELAMATSLIDALSEDWTPAKYEDTQRKRVLELLEQKASGVEAPVLTVVPDPEPKADDLMAAMAATVAAAKAAKAASAA